MRFCFVNSRGIAEFLMISILRYTYDSNLMIRHRLEWEFDLIYPSGINSKAKKSMEHCNLYCSRIIILIIPDKDKGNVLLQAFFQGDRYSILFVTKSEKYLVNDNNTQHLQGVYNWIKERKKKEKKKKPDLDNILELDIIETRNAY